ncbi:hypothetical protein acdb102_22380 [Acidothermaceae bacterium B102]|nr:hypothetical protein acdb102_22380 [Acidothermaceae bacterium B102]
MTGLASAVLGHAWWTSEHVNTLVTAATGLAIAAQAVYTRLAVEQQTAVQHESIKARLEQRGPRVAVGVKSVEQTLFQLSAFGKEQPYKAGITVTTPAEDDQPLMLEALLELRNEGDRRVVITYERGIMPPASYWSDARAWGDRTQYLGADGASLELAAVVEQTQRAWIAGFSSAQTADGGTAASWPVVEFTVSDELDEGITDTYRVQFDGVPLIPVPGDAGKWQITVGSLTGAVITCRVSHAGRTYWLSRERGMTLTNVPALRRRSRHWLSNK